MTVLIVGADRLGSIPKRLQNEGVNKIIHWSGRSSSFQKKTIPRNVDKIIVLCDFLNHNLMHSVKNRAKSCGIPVIYNKRSIAWIG
ncbi:MAG TPA: dihydroorotate dehydrogenase [Pelotomaculum sp.]|nr:dihydroorotate dehydrogenase [Pelotomaculum sp.]